MGLAEDMAAYQSAELQNRNNQMFANMKTAADPSIGPQMQYNPIDEATGMLKKQYQMPGGEGYMQALLKKQGLEEAQGQDKAAAQAQGAQANAAAGLGMRGGMNSANRGALARQSMTDSLKAQQGVAAQGAGQRADIGIKGADVEQAATGQNIQGALTGISGINKFNLDKYGQNMAGLSANAAAQATADATKNQGSWVCTESHKRNPLSRKEAFALFRLRKFALKNYKEMSNAYLYDFKPLVEKMLEKGDDWAENNAFVQKVVEMVNENRLPEAFKFYVNYIQAKVEIFWPECENKEYLKLKEEN
jgi:hypothetical protein